MTSPSSIVKRFQLEFQLTDIATERGILDLKDKEMLENFDDLFIGNPIEIEKNLRGILPKALLLENHSIYLQMLSQIALTQAMQKNFDGAHETLDAAEKLLTPLDYLARVRILIERGRVLWRSGHDEVAIPLFQQSYELSQMHGFDEHTCNAAHLVAIIIKDVKEKIKWNELALALAECSKVPRGRAWLGSLYNNLGGAYVEAKQFEKALQVFEKAMHFRELEGVEPNIRVAKWQIARSLRCLNRHEESLRLLLDLKHQYEVLIETNMLDIPIEILSTARGLVYAELAEIYVERKDPQAKEVAKIAYADLSKDEWMQRLEPARLARLKQLEE
ncbi:MAG: tetratricopeptide repeat protein [Chlamydiota bacterium]